MDENAFGSDEVGSSRDVKEHYQSGLITYEIKNTWEEAKLYDFAGARSKSQKCNVTESIGHLVKSCLAGGILAIHESYKACGLWTALILNVLLGFAVSYCMWMLARSAQRMYGRVAVPKMIYPDLAQAAAEVGPWVRGRRFAKIFRYCVDGLFMVDLFGSCCVYQVVIARSIKQLVEGNDTVEDAGNPHVRVYIVCLLVPCALLCIVLSLKYLAPFTVVTDVFLITMAVSTIVYAVGKNPPNPTTYRFFGTVPGVFEFMGACVFSIEGITVTLAIENNMKEPKKIPIVLVVGMSFVVTLIMIVGFFGYWGFGEKSKSPVTVNFPYDLCAYMLKVFIIIAVYISIALNFWIPFELAWYYLKRHHRPERHWLWEKIYRCVFVTIITLVATLFPTVSKFMGLLGSFCLSNIGFIFPALIELSIEWEHPGLGFMKWRLVKAILICLFGAVLFAVGTIINGRELIREVFNV